MLPLLWHYGELALAARKWVLPSIPARPQFLPFWFPESRFSLLGILAAYWSNVLEQGGSFQSCWPCGVRQTSEPFGRPG